MYASDLAAVDISDLAKPYAKHVEYLDHVRYGSRKEKAHEPTGEVWTKDATRRPKVIPRAPKRRPADRPDGRWTGLRHRRRGNPSLLGIPTSLVLCPNRQTPGKPTALSPVLRPVPQRKRAS